MQMLTKKEKIELEELFLSIGKQKKTSKLKEKIRNILKKSTNTQNNRCVKK
ncbi:hypothetical protein [Campylobacter blaseri]|uniref:hypothetical protein n=1 Tax=Campylobacter blaseri TaxID=2042961 RepID=UPI0012FFFE40|nr:hypothetical protein [Campylobacter blaseri]